MWLSLSTASWANQGHQQTPKSRQGIRWKYIEPRCRPAKRLYCRLWSDKIICFCVPKPHVPPWIQTPFRRLHCAYYSLASWWATGKSLVWIWPLPRFFSQLNFHWIMIFFLKNELYKTYGSGWIDLVNAWDYLVLQAAVPIRPGMIFGWFFLTKLSLECQSSDLIIGKRGEKGRKG